MQKCALGWHGMALELVCISREKERPAFAVSLCRIQKGSREAHGFHGRAPKPHGHCFQAMEKLKSPEFRLVDFFALGQGMPEEVFELGPGLGG